MSPAQRDLLLVLCGVHSIGFALFHLAFWRLFDWPRSLQGTTRVNGAVLQILNLRLVWVLLGAGAACFAFPDALQGTPLGRALLAFMALFWAGRTVEQFVYLRIDRPAVHVLTGLFVLGVALFALPLLPAPGAG